MAERIAVVGLLNKRNGLVRELEMKPGESVRVGRAIVRMRACEMTAPWEDPPETGAFVQLTVQDQRDRSEEHTSELQSLMRISYAVFCLKKKHQPTDQPTNNIKYIQSDIITKQNHIQKHTRHYNRRKI